MDNIYITHNVLVELMMNNKKGLKKNKEFSEVFKKGKSVADRNLVLYCLAKDQSFTRFGFSVGKKVGKAVIRNRYKRILREICRVNSNVLKEGYDCIIIARPKILGENYCSVKKSFFKLARKIKIVGNEMV